MSFGELTKTSLNDCKSCHGLRGSKKGASCLLLDDAVGLSSQFIFIASTTGFNLKKLSYTMPTSLRTTIGLAVLLSQQRYRPLWTTRWPSYATHPRCYSISLVTSFFTCPPQEDPTFRLHACGIPQSFKPTPGRSRVSSNPLPVPILTSLSFQHQPFAPPRRATRKQKTASSPPLMHKDRTSLPWPRFSISRWEL